MRNLATWVLVSVSIGSLIACQDDDPPASAPTTAVRTVVPRRVPQIAPPLDLKLPPGDAMKTDSGLVYKRLVANTAGAQPKGDDTVMVRYTGWRQRTGETFFTIGGGSQPIAIDLAHAAAGFREALPLLHKGEKAVLWMPPEAGTAEPIAYEVELVDILTKPTDERRTAPAAARTTAATPRTAAR